MNYTISTIDDGKTFTCALHFVVMTRWDTIAAASFVGRSSAVKAVTAAAFTENRELSIEVPSQPTRKGIVLPVQAFTKKVGNAWHTLLLPKSWLEPSENPIILAPDGDINQAIGRYLCSRFAIPAEWELQYADILSKEELLTFKNPEIPMWENLRAVLLGGITEENILQIIDTAIKDKKLKIPPSLVQGKFNPNWSLQEYLRENTEIFARQVDAVVPLHSEKDSIDPAVVMERVPFPAQAHAAMGLVKALKKEPVVILCGAMGTGKSIISLAVCNTIHAHAKKESTRVLLSAPGLTIPKWQRKEIGETLPDAKVYTIHSTEDATRYLRMAREGKLPEGLNFVLVGIDRAKLGPDLWCAAKWRRIRQIEYNNGKPYRAYLGPYAWHCPDCGQWIPNPDIKDETVPAEWEFFAKGTPDNPLGWRMPPKIRKCPHCDAALFRPALKSRGETRNKPRWFVCNILKRLKKHFDLYIADEVHQTKAQNSGRGHAFAQMVKSSKKTLVLTGTLLNGKSTSIKEILWRTDSRSLLNAGFNHKSGMVQWASRYGVLERVVYADEGDTGVVTHRKQRERQPKEKPGIAPQLVAEQLLHRAVFLELSDLGLPLINLKEKAVIVDLDPEHENRYKNFHSQLQQACAEAYANGIPGAYSKLIPATINAVDRPDQNQLVEIGNNIIPFEGFDADYLSSKDRCLIDIVTQNLAEDRGCVIYCSYTDSYAVHKRLQRILHDHGIEAEILESNTSTEERFDWLQQAEKRGAKVIITNLRLVEVGLDLLAWPTLIYYQMSYDINSVRQAGGRAWRIGQTRECRNIYLVANGTQQVAQFQCCMTKRAHAMLAEGKLDRSELAEYGRDASNSLATDLASCLADSDLATRWEKLAKKDLNMNTISEDQFLEVLRKTQDELVQETLHLAGLQDEFEIDNSPIFIPAMPPKRRRRSKKSIVIPGQLAFNF
jgi:hypothetical protein